ncbi:MAG: sodium:proton antiporter [Actinobacteria bacterium]|nr:MAG: sodium:proton antiporter [Actinomycetota bacterium]
MTPLERMVAIGVLLVALLISFSHLVGAEQGPGDGFTAGVISSLGITLQYAVFGIAETRRMLKGLRFQPLMIAGLATALVAAVLPLFTTGVLLGHLAIRAEVPALGTIELTQATLFDIGVYLLVVGGATWVIENLGEELE